MDLKLVALDVDGTLLNKQKQILPSVKEAIQAVQQRGIHVTLCTGRMFASAFPYAQALQLALPIITYNGGLVVHPGTKEVLYERSLAAAYATEIIREARRRGLTINYYHKDRLLVEEITAGNRDYAWWSGVDLQKVDDLLALAVNPTKILLIGEPEILQSVEQEYGKRFGKQVYITRSWPQYLEFLHPEATKGRGLAVLAQYLGLTRSQIMGIGDSYNDLEMFNHTGLAVAMANAEAPVRAAAHYVTASNEEGGVALALQKFILGAGSQARVN